MKIKYIWKLAAHFFKQIVMKNVNNIFNKTTSIPDEAMDRYNIIESYRNSENTHMLVVKVCNSTRGVFTISALELVLHRKDILSCFGIKDLTIIIGLLSSDKETEVVYKRSKAYKYDTIIAMLFGVLMVSTNITSTKLTTILGVTMTGSFISYPMMYLIGDVVTEVYGYKKARQLVWGAVLGNIIMVAFLQLSVLFPPSDYWHNQEAYSLIIGSVPLIVIASILAYLCGEFLNSYTLSKAKMHYNGGNLIIRLLCASFVGVIVDSVIFTLIAYGENMSSLALFSFTITMICKKLLQIITFIPISVWVINSLKKAEGVNIIDTNTNFTPFSLDVNYSEYNNLFTKLKP
jgi:uncharacterized integral membrane protein (TIGR00697 family)